MPRHRPLDSFAGPVVADTSVVINLNATGCSETLLAALPNPVLVAEHVVQELQHERSRQHQDAGALASLVEQRLVAVVSLGRAGHNHFTELVSGAAASTLDDGEAATIAAALEQGGLALIDERKALGICASRFEDLCTGSTVDLLRHPHIQAVLSREALADAVFGAAYCARMRVQPHDAEWVVRLIGRKRAERCTSLRKILRAVNPNGPPPAGEVREARGRSSTEEPPTLRSRRFGS